jgi:hypothetical protein
LFFKTILLCALVAAFGIQVDAVAAFSVAKSRPLYGPQNLYAQSFHDLHIIASLYDEVVLSKCLVHGPFIIDGGKVTLNDCAIHCKIELLKNMPSQIIYLRGNTVVSGDILFNHGIGEVVLCDNAKIYGRVIGGTVIDCRNKNPKMSSAAEDVLNVVIATAAVATLAYGFVQLATADSARKNSEADKNADMLLSNAHVEEEIVLKKLGRFYDSTIRKIYVEKYAANPVIHLYGDTVVEEIEFEGLCGGIVVLHGAAQVLTCIGGTLVKAV